MNRTQAPRCELHPGTDGKTVTFIQSAKERIKKYKGKKKHARNASGLEGKFY